MELCDNCGEPAHVYYCMKPPKVSKATWQAMNDDERIEAYEAYMLSEQVRTGRG